MIRNNLASLMGERRLKITRVAKETGISRNTITSIAQNDSDMFRVDTINTLCKYLGVTPCEFFEYEPVDIEFSVYINNFDCILDREFPFFQIFFKEIKADIILDVIKQNHTQSFDLTCSLAQGIYKIPGDGAYIVLNIEFEDTQETEEFLTNIYNKIKPSFRQDIYSSISNKVHKAILERTIEEIDNTYYSLDEKNEYVKLAKYDLAIDIVSDVFKKF